MPKALFPAILLVILGLIACSYSAPTAVAPLATTPQPEATAPAENRAEQTQSADPAYEPTIVATPRPTEILTEAPDRTPALEPTVTATPTPTDIPTAEPDSASLAERTPSTRDLSELLNMVPAEFSDDTLVFSFNHPGSTGYLFAKGRAWHPEIQTNIVNLNEMMGLDFRSYEQGIWSLRPGNNPLKTFMAIQGPIVGQQTTNKLRDLDFRETSYRNTTYFELDEDFSVDIKHPLGRTGLFFNRLVLLEDSILAAPATGIIESLIAARQPGSQTLMASLPHSSLTNAAGDGLVSGAFFRPQWIAETWNSVNPRPADRLDRYRAGAEAWGTLSDYGLALLGYRAREDADEIVVALYYPATAYVEANSRELVARWNNYLYDPSGPLSEAADIPLNEACSPLSVQTIQHTDHSIIVGSCSIIKDEDTVSGTGPSLWRWLFNTRQLEFLAPGIEDLK